MDFIIADIPVHIQLCRFPFPWQVNIHCFHRLVGLDKQRTFHPDSHHHIRIIGFAQFKFTDYYIFFNTGNIAVIIIHPFKCNHALVIFILHQRFFFHYH